MISSSSESGARSRDGHGQHAVRARVVMDASPVDDIDTRKSSGRRRHAAAGAISTTQLVGVDAISAADIYCTAWRTERKLKRERRTEREKERWLSIIAYDRQPWPLISHQSADMQTCRIADDGVRPCCCCRTDGCAWRACGRSAGMRNIDGGFVGRRDDVVVREQTQMMMMTAMT